MRMLASLVPGPQEQVDFPMGLVLTEQKLCLWWAAHGCHFLLGSSPCGHTSTVWSQCPPVTAHSPSWCLWGLWGFLRLWQCSWSSPKAVLALAVHGSMCSGVMPWLCLWKALSLWEKSLWWQLLLPCSYWLSPQILSAARMGRLGQALSLCGLKRVEVLFHALKKPWWGFTQLLTACFSCFHCSAWPGLFQGVPSAWVTVTTSSSFTSE